MSSYRNLVKLQMPGHPRNYAAAEPWDREPVPRLARKVPDRVAKLRALGNSIVPEIAEFIFRLIRGTYDRGD